ncbi:S-adenosyl-l-methionine hydroxide adenosyltransferase family protein [Acidobacteriota bacterium]
MIKVDNPIIALMSDFGEDDYFVPSLKGVIASINPEAKVVDITHNIPSFDVLAGSFVLFASYRFFPKKTIFVAVIDPGVGSSRKIFLVETDKYCFIAPDNGILSLVLEEEGVYRATEISNPKFFLSQTSVTFDGRDKMAPVSAWLSLGVPPEEFGPSIKDIQKNELSLPHQTDEKIQGVVLYKDKFGNLITNISLSQLDPFLKKYGREDVCLIAGDNTIMYGDFYSAVPTGESVFLFGSLGLIEIAVREGSAFDKLKVKPGDRIKIELLNNQ